MNDKHYLSELPREELKDFILYPSDLWNDIYEIVAEGNGRYACDLADWILGKDHHEWTKLDASSYDWWMNIKEEQYARVLGITDYDYFSDDDAKEVKRLQKEIKKLDDKIGKLSDMDEKGWEMSDKADELADKIIQIVVKEIKLAEEVTDEQCLEFFENNYMGDNYYWLGDDKTRVYCDYTKSYKTNYKEGQ